MNNKREFLDTLKEMKGKSFVYAKTTHKLCDYSIDDHRQRVTIKTDKRTFERTYDEVGEFLRYFEPVIETEAEEVAEKKEETNNGLQVNSSLYNEQVEVTKDLISILRDNIEKVKKDKSYIPQAQSINNNVNSIISITKLQLDVYKQFKGKNGQSS